MNERLKQLVDPQGFDNLFLKEISKGKSHTQAFEELNREYKEAFGRDRYSSYDSYRKTRAQRIKS